MPAQRYNLVVGAGPLSPFFLVNPAAGLTRLPVGRFVVLTVVGFIAGGLVYCNAGASLGEAGSIREILSGREIFSFL